MEEPIMESPLKKEPKKWLKEVYENYQRDLRQRRREEIIETAKSLAPYFFVGAIVLLAIVLLLWFAL